MRVGFITSLHNHLPLTQAMWTSLTATLPRDLAWEIVCHDDGSTDGTRDWLRQLAASDPRVRVILAERNVGFAAGNNAAARAANADILFFLNNDLVLLPGWFEPMFALVSSSDPQLGFVGNLQLTVRDRTLDHRGVKFDTLRRPFHDRTPRPWHARRPASFYPAVTAACCAIRRELFLAHGGFDEAFRNGYEDIDLCLRLGRAGHRHCVANRSVVLHHVSGSAGRFAHEEANRRLYHARWGWPQDRLPPRLRGRAYLATYWRRPWRYNGSKLLLALAWVATNRPCEPLRARLRTHIKF